MVIFLCILLMGVMLSLRSYALRLAEERRRKESSHVVCPKCNKEVERLNSTPYCTKCYIFF
ncbi:hypothetical protein ACFFJY_18960 [Fictibacillus aquaticus]|uniref:hypothetical protein n=1 Tax=Fictibacillus aquaticus TaxID=2021314 RepID=UPI001055317B|nr:hypothetical protein [Fictibacillus aquaticus]